MATHDHTTDPTVEAAAAKPHRAPEPPDFKRSVRRFMSDEDGQSMVEFAIILPMFLFLVMGIVQFMLIANAAYFLNYGNFMAMRTAAARWEMSPVGRSGTSQGDSIPGNVKSEARNTLRYCLLPAIYMQGDKLTSLTFLVRAKNRLQLDSTRAWLESSSEVDYPLLIPFARNIISAIAGGQQGSDDYYAEVLPFDSDQGSIFGIPLPDFLSYKTVNIKTNSGVDATGQNKDYKPHKILIHRRW